MRSMQRAWLYVGIIDGGCLWLNPWMKTAVPSAIPAGRKRVVRNLRIASVAIILFANRAPHIVDRVIHTGMCASNAMQN